jgi:putative acetyltransferase
MTFEPLDPEDPAAQALIAGLGDHLARLYLYQRNHAQSVQSLKLTNVYFLGAYVDGELVGCGAVKTLDNDGEYGEIKTVFVAEPHRGRGYSRALMHQLEAHLRSIGIGVARLATGIRQPEAVSLYASLGYVRCSPFGDHAADPMSVFMEKTLGV